MADAYRVRLLASIDVCSSIIGRSGSNITRIRQSSKARISVETKKKTIQKCVISIEGTKESITTALKLIIQTLNKDVKLKSKFAIQRNIEINFLLSQKAAGAVIGLHGRNYNRICQNGKVYLSIGKEFLPRSNEKTCTVRGNLKNVTDAVLLILQLYFEVYSYDYFNNMIYYDPQVTDFDVDSNSLGSSIPKKRKRSVFERIKKKKNLIPYSPNETVNIKFPISRGFADFMNRKGGFSVIQIAKKTGVRIGVNKNRNNHRKNSLVINGLKSKVREALFMVDDMIKNLYFN